MSKPRKRSDKTPNRSYNKIDSLPTAIKEAVETMMCDSKFTYREIAGFIWDNAEVRVHESMICRYVAKLNKSMREISTAQENLRIIISETAKYPELDATDCVIRLLTSRMIEAVNNIPEESWVGLDPMQVMDKWSKLMKVISQKKDVDNKIKSIREIGFESVKDEVFTAIREENPKLYNELVDYLNSKQTEGE